MKMIEEMVGLMRTHPERIFALNKSLLCRIKENKSFKALEIVSFSHHQFSETFRFFRLNCSKKYFVGVKKFDVKKFWRKKSGLGPPTWGWAKNYFTPK